MDSQWSEWSTCSTTCGVGSQRRTRLASHCPNIKDIDSQETSCLVKICPKVATTKTPPVTRTLLPTTVTSPVPCNISDELIAEIRIMLNQECTKYDWTEWSVCQNPCSGRRTRCTKTKPVLEPTTIQYEECAQINQCTQPEECQSDWGVWSSWETTMPNIQARIRINNCNDHDIDYRHNQPVASYVKPCLKKQAPKCYEIGKIYPADDIQQSTAIIQSQPDIPSTYAQQNIIQQPNSFQQPNAFQPPNIFQQPNAFQQPYVFQQAQADMPPAYIQQAAMQDMVDIQQPKQPITETQFGVPPFGGISIGSVNAALKNPPVPVDPATQYQYVEMVPNQLKLS